jgi:hypothetical protein
VGEPIRTQGTGVEERQALLLQTRARIADMLGQELTPQPLAPAGDGEAR